MLHSSPFLLPCSLPTCCHPPEHSSAESLCSTVEDELLQSLSWLLCLFSAPREQGKFKESELIAWIPSHLNCAWGSPRSDEGTYTPAVSNTVATSRIATANTDFFTAPSKITFTSSFLPHVSWAFFLALGIEGQPCNMSKRKSGSVLSPETYKGVRTEPLCFSCFGEREYTALLLSAGTEPGSLVKKAVGARTNSVPHGLPVVAYKRVWAETSYSCLKAQCP